MNSNAANGFNILNIIGNNTINNQVPGHTTSSANAFGNFYGFTNNALHGMQYFNNFPSLGQSSSQIVPPIKQAPLLPLPFQIVQQNQLQVTQGSTSSSLALSPNPYTVVEKQHERLFSIHGLKFVSNSQPRRLLNVPSKQVLDNEAARIQDQISNRGNCYVTWNEIVYELISKYQGCKVLGDLGLAKADDLFTIRRLIQYQKFIDSFIQMYTHIKSESCLILSELESLMITTLNACFFKDGKVKLKHFLDLKLGPLTKNCLIGEIFKLNELTEEELKRLSPIEFKELVNSIDQFLSITSKWAEKKLDVKAAEDFIMKKYRVDKMSLLGLKMMNGRDIIINLKNIRRAHCEIYRELQVSMVAKEKENVTSELKQLINNGFQNFARFDQMIREASAANNVDHMLILASEFDSYCSKQRYLQMQPTALLKEINRIFMNLQGNECLQNLPHGSYFINTLAHLLFELERSDYFADLFQLAICMCNTNLNSCLDRLIQNFQISAFNSQAMNADHQHMELNMGLKLTEYVNYQCLMVRLLRVLLDSASYSHSIDELKCILNQSLMTWNMMVIDSNELPAQTSESKQNGDEKLEFNADRQERFVNQLDSIFDSYLRDLAKRNHKSKHLISLDAFLEMDKYVQEQKQFCLDDAADESNVNFSFLEFLSRNQSLFKKHKLYSISLVDGATWSLMTPQLGDNRGISNRAVNQRERHYVMEYLRQVKSSLEFEEENNQAKPSEGVFNDSGSKISEKLESFCCNYFRLKQFEEMGLGPLSSVLNKIARRRGMNGTEDRGESCDEGDDEWTNVDGDEYAEETRGSGFIYLDSLLNYDDCHFIRSRSERKMSPDFVQATKVELLKKLFECPPLENVEQHVRWRQNNYESIFNADLKQFIADVNREGVRFDSIFDSDYLTKRGLEPGESFSMDVLEIEPHGRHLVKLTRSASFDSLKSAISKGDFVEASGLLVSLIALNYGSLRKCCCLLLVNEMQSGFQGLLQKSADMESYQEQQPRTAQINLNGLLLNDLEKFYLSLNEKNELFIYKTHKYFYWFLVEFIYRLPSRMAEQLLHFCLIDSIKGLFENDSQAFYEYLFVALVIDKFRRLLVNWSQAVRSEEDLAVLFDSKKSGNKSSPESESQREKCITRLVELLSLDDKIEHFLGLGKAGSINQWSRDNMRLILGKLVDIVRCYSTPTAVSSSSALQSNAKTPVVTDETEKTQNEPSHKNDPTSNLQAESGLQLQSSADVKCILTNDSSMNEKLIHVMEIRRRYGADVIMNDGERFITESLKGVLGRSIESLSSELYNKDLHFVLELIQNADDNSYEKIDNVSQSDAENPEAEALMDESLMAFKFKHEPTLVFIFEEDCIILFNNETGFEMKNIEALCNIKSSTKGKYQRGCIGRKGIGFKSVFTITNRPEIHSNGYHVKFDLDANGKIGYILPTWIEDSGYVDQIATYQSHLAQKLENKFHELTSSSSLAGTKKSVGALNTCIKLPLKSHKEFEHGKTTLLKNSSNAIRPYLLLFLNRLKNLVVIIQDKSMESALARLQGSGEGQGEEVSQFKIEHFYFRNDLNENLVEICCESKKYLPNGDSIKLESSNHKWIVLRQCLSIPENVKPSDTNVESTDLCLAFPLEQLSFDKTRGLQRGQPLKKMDVFAYLPLRPFGFSFIIQADFVVPASRQDVRQDSVWNQWLCKQIPALFVDSLELFKRHNDFADQIDALKAYLKFIPLEEEILGFFQHIPRQIMELLCSREFLPAVEEKPDESEGYEIVWKKPSECIILRDKFIREVLTSDLLKMSLGRYYLHPDLIDYISEENLTNLVHSLGVKTLNLGDILKILNSIFAMQAGNSSEDDPVTSSVMKYDLNDLKTTAKWLVILQHLLSNCSSNDRDRLLKDIKQLPFIPIKAFKNGSVHREFSSLNALNIFMPIKLSTSIENKKVFQKNVKSNNLPSKQPSSTAGTLSDQFVASFEAITIRIQKYLNLLDFEALFCLDESSNNKLMSLFETLGVRRVMPREVIESHIAPKLTEYNSLLKQQQSQTQAYEEELVDYLVYIHDVWALSKRHDQHNAFLLGNYYLNDETIVTELKDLLWLKTNRGLKQPRGLDSADEDSNESIYLSSEFGPQNQLATIFPSYPWCFVDPIYLKSVMSNLREYSKQKADANNLNDKLRSNWKHFLMLIGVDDTFSPELKRFVFTRSELENVTTDLSTSDLGHSLKFWYSQHLDLLKNLRSDEAFLFEDYDCEVFNFYAEKIESATADVAAKPIPEALKSELNNLFIAIHDNWSPKEAQNNSNRHLSSLTAPLNSYRHARVRIVKKSSTSGAGYNLQNAFPYKDPFCESIFFRNLKEKRWIQADFSKFQPVFNHLGQVTSAYLEMLTLYEQPSEIYLRDQTIYRHYGHFMVPFLSESLNAHLSKRLLINNSPDYLPIELGFNYKFDLEEFIQLLKSKVFIKETCFVASIEQMKLIYSCLKDAIQNDFRSGNNATEAAIKDCPFIFVPQAKLDTKYNRSEEYVIGLFYTNREVCWSDPLQLFEKYSKVKLSLQAELSTEDHVFGRKFMSQPSFQLIQGIYADNASSNDEETARDDHYGHSNENLETLFVKTFKLRQAPNLEHYVDLLEFIVILAMLKLKEESNEAENKSSSIRSNMFHILKSVNLNEMLVDIFAIFSDFGRRFDAFKMDRQREFLKMNLLQAIGDTLILPCFNNQFKSFIQMFERDLPVLADNLDLGKLFIYKLNMVVIPSTRPSFMSRNISSILDSGTKKLDQQEQALKQIIQLKQQSVLEPIQEDYKQPSNQLSVVEEDQQAFADVCSLDHLDDFARIFLVEVLGLKMFSKIISLDLNKIETENLRPAPVVQNLLAKAVPYIQCFIYWRREYKSIYQLLSQDKELALDKRLKEARFYSVKELNTIYRCTFDSTIKAELSNKTIMDSTNAGGKRSYWIYYVRHDQLEDKRELIKGFLKLFIPKPSQEKAELFQTLGINNDLLTSFEDALTTFCLYSIFPYFDKSLKKKDREIIENDLKVKFTLPDEEVQWQIDEVKEPTIETKVPSTAENTKDGNETQDAKEKPKKAPAETREERALREKEKLKEALKLNYLSETQINAQGHTSEQEKPQAQTIQESTRTAELVETKYPGQFDVKAHQIYMNAYDEVEKPAEIKDQEAEKKREENLAVQKQYPRESHTDEREQQKKVISQDETWSGSSTNTGQVNAYCKSILPEWINDVQNAKGKKDNDYTANNSSRKRISDYEEHWPSKEFRSHEMVTYKYQNGEMKVQLRERDFNFVKPPMPEQEPKLIEFSASDWSSKALDDLNKVVMPLDQLEALGIRAKLEKIGRWGEMWVFEVLKQRYKREIAANEMRVVWLNEETETGLPYDFIVIDMNRLNRLTASNSPSCPEELEIMSEDVRFYIEVKTTTRMNREYFFISYNELMFAKSHAEKFVVYRLYNGYNDPAQTKLKEISDIPAHLHSQHIKLFMYI